MAGRRLTAAVLLATTWAASCDLGELPQQQSPHVPGEDSKPADLIPEPADARALRNVGAFLPQRQPAASSSTSSSSTAVSSSKGYFQRLGESLLAALLGLFGVIFSIPVLWLNERRNARMECVITQGRSGCVSASAAERENRGRLVHVEGGDAQQAALVVDEHFCDVALKASCLRLRTTIEIFQWVQHSQTRTEERIGGRETTTTVYTYSKEWASCWHNSASFQDPAGHENSKPVGLDPGCFTNNCSRVEFGTGFLLPDDLVSQLGTFEPAGKLLGASVRSRAGGHVLQQVDGEWYYLRRHASTHPLGSTAQVAVDPSDVDIVFPADVTDAWEAAQSPEVGDVRVRFEVVKPGPVTVLALQVESQADEARDTFLPFRLISKGLCGLRSEEEKRRRIEQGRRSTTELAEQDACSWGPLALLCCACNCVTLCMSALPPELFHCFPGSVSRPECFRVVSSRNKLATWLLRFGGWLLMFWGLYGMFSPVITLLAVVPFIKSLGAAAIWIVCLLLTLVVASFIIFLAYLVYHPVLALGALAMVAAAIAIPNLIGLALPH